LTRTVVYAVLIGAPIVYSEGNPAITGAIPILLLIIRVIPTASFKRYEANFVEGANGIGVYLQNRKAATDDS